MGTINSTIKANTNIYISWFSDILFKQARARKKGFVCVLTFRVVENNSAITIQTGVKKTKSLETCGSYYRVTVIN